MIRPIALVVGMLALGAGSLACGKPAETPAPGAQAGPAPAPAGDAAAKGRAAVEKGQTYLRAQQGLDGAWGVPGMRPAEPGITAIVVTALLRTTPGATRATQPAIWKGLDYLLAKQKPDGAVFDGENANYVTSVSVMAFLESRDPAFREAAGKAAAYVGEAILDEKEGANPKDNVHYGGAGYEKRRPDQTELYADLSNTSYSLEALKQARDAGIPVDEKAFAAAIRFLERTQHRSESNDQPWASDDPRVAGGFVYHPKESKAGEMEINGKTVLLPYGSMTYAGVKSFIHARVGKDDPRVKAAVDWIRKFYTLEENPGFDVSRPDKDLGQQGLYYYYDTFAKAHEAIGEDRFADVKGVVHDWRAELIDALASRQRADGAWVNDRSEKWMEGNPSLATAYCVLALSYAVPAK